MALRVNSLQRFRARAFQWRIVLLNLLFLFWGGTGLAYATHAEAIHEAIGYDSHGTLIQPGEEGTRPQPRSQRPLLVAADVENSGAGDRNILAEAVSPTPLPPAPERAPLVNEVPGDSGRNDSTQRSVIGLTPKGEPEPESTLYSANDSGDESHNGYARKLPASLEWLRDHQNPEGYWSARHSDHDSVRTDVTSAPFAKNYPRAVRHPGNAYADVAVTALALMCFIDSGYDHKEGDFRQTVRQALLWMRKIQRRNGSFEGARNLHDHALVVMALTEVYGLSGDSVFKPICDKAVEYLLAKRSPGSGWGQDSHYAPDMESTWYAVLALKSARMAGLEFACNEAWDEVGEFLDLMAVDGDGDVITRWSATADFEPGVTAYDPIAKSFVHAAWVATALFIGHTDLNDERIKRRTEFLVQDENLPRYEYPYVDFRTWYVASVALYQCGGVNWKTWEKALATALLESQRGCTESDKSSGWTSKNTLREHGSWDPIDTADEFGGRVHSTAMASLTIAITQRYRYLRLEEGE